MRCLLAILLLGVVRAVAGETNAPAADETVMAKPAPAFLLKNLDGLDAHSTNYNGQVRIVFFWASWDKPCQKQLPALVELQRDYGAAGLTVLGLVLDAKDPAKLKQFATDHSINFPILVADYGVIQGFGGLEAIPTTFVVERHGIIVRRYVGLAGKESLQRIVEAILHQSSQ